MWTIIVKFFFETLIVISKKLYAVRSSENRTAVRFRPRRSGGRHIEPTNNRTRKHTKQNKK